MDILNEAEYYVFLSRFKESVEITKGYIPDIVRLMAFTYGECKKAGFDEKQSFEFAKEYAIKLLLTK